ncbi:MAG TPA: hypothetical protein VIU61_30885, partial [Kofleriaceae bacterium]
MKPRTSIMNPLALIALLGVPLVGCIDEEGTDAGEELLEEDELEAGAAIVVNNSPAYLVVYNNNIENMLPANCNKGDWNRLFNYIKAQAQSPDLLVVQQISNQAQLNTLTARMTNELPGTYAGVIAIANPGSMGYDDNRCEVLKNHQTNAVIYRSDRFTKEGETRWRSDAPRAKTGPCENLSAPAGQDRVENVGVLLYDRVAKQRVSVSSLHWPTSTWKGPECADENIKEANEASDRLGGTLKILAGDMNTSKGTKGWWNDARDFGFRDPIAETCPSSGCPD